MKQRVVIIGGGFAGVECAKRLSERLKNQPNWEIVLLSADSYLLFFPLLIKVAVGSLEARHISVNLRSYLPDCTITLGQFLGFSPVRRSVRYRLLGKDKEAQLEYDHLIIAMGGTSKVPDIPGLKNRALTMKNIKDAQNCYHNVIQRLEEANALDALDQDRKRQILSFAVVGGGYTGVELASELKGLLEQARKNYPKVRAEDISVHLIEMQGQLMGAKNNRLERAVRSRLDAQGVLVHLNESVKELEDGLLTLASGRQLSVETVFWAGGLTPNPVIANLPVPKSKDGLIQTTEYLNVAGLHDVWAIGDCASNPTQKGGTLPLTAQIAKKLAKHLVKNILNFIEQRPLLAHRVKSQGMLLPMSGRFAILYTNKLVIKGRLPWIMWFGYHAFMIPQVRNKSLVLFELLLNQIFGRDLSDPAMKQTDDRNIKRIA